MAVKINREELAWAAGFFDGEGHTAGGLKRARVGKPKNQRRIATRIGQRHREPLERFKAAVGDIGVIRESLKLDRPWYSYSTGSYEKSQAVIAMLWPFLCDVKRAQAAEVLVNYRNHRKDGQ